MTVGPPRVQEPYPFTKLDDAKAQAAADGLDIIDFGIGDPQDPTPESIRQALRDGVTESSSYPKAGGLPELKEAISEWITLRFGASVPAADVLPTLGSKEILHSLPAYLLTDERDLVLIPAPAYPVYERGATFHGGRVEHLPLTNASRWLPDLDAVSDETWARTALLWVNYPNNPTAAVAPLSFYRRAAELARTHGFVLASDEAYSKVWFDEAPSSALEVEDLTNVVVVNTLSKRSCMTGYRSGFITGDPSIIDRLRTYRPSVGVTPQDFVQRAAVAAWQDENHVVAHNRRWAERRAVFLPVFANAGLNVLSDATFFLWVTVPSGHTSETFAELLLSIGVVVSPGTFFGVEGEGFVRLALVPTLERCQDAAARIHQLLLKESS